MMTAAEHAELTARLVALVVEYAAASQKAEATAKVHHVLEALPQGDGDQVDSEEAAAQQARVTALLADNDLLCHNLAAAEAKATALEGELAQLRAAAKGAEIVDPGSELGQAIVAETATEHPATAGDPPAPGDPTAE